MTKASIRKTAAIGKTEIAASSDSKSDYFVMPGVEWVNRRRVKGGKVTLSKVEAKFDLDHGRISKEPFKDQASE